jgi:hypothetical protein
VGHHPQLVAADAEVRRDVPDVVWGEELTFERPGVDSEDGVETPAPIACSDGSVVLKSPMSATRSGPAPM